MSNLIQETEQELMNHHHINIHQQQLQHDNKKMQMQMQMKKLSYVGSNSNDSGYELRKDPKKTPKVKQTNTSNCFVVLDKLCKECGKGFKSWKALFGHMKCHSKKVSKNKLNQGSWISRLDDGGIKKSRSRNKRSKRYVVSSTSVTTTTTITAASSSMYMNTNNNNNNHGLMSVFSDIEKDQESEIAMCLMMLSRDEGEWGNGIESSDYCKSSAFVRLTKTDGQKLVKNSVKRWIGGHDPGRSEVGSTGLEKIMSENDGLDDEIESSKRKFECITCNKRFQTYQALGGHNASHKKLKEVQDLKTEGENIIEDKPLFRHENMLNGLRAKPSDDHNKIKKFNLGDASLKKTVMLGAYECRICLKVFSSGQALGGHKRSHMMTEAKLNQQTNMSLIERVDEPIRGFLDLNMVPDTMEEDVVMNSGTTGYKPWHWADTTNHEPTTLLGLL